MAKARWLKPEFFTDARLSQVSDQAALLYPALWVEADDGGVAPGDPRIIYGRRFITRPGWTVETVATALEELRTIGVVRCFSEESGERWVWIPKLMEQQGTKAKEWRYLDGRHVATIKRVQAENNGANPGKAEKS